MFNADLALSVTMTAISTLLSIVMLPVNLIIYASTSYSSAVVKSLDWAALFHSLVTVIGAITAGLICSATVSSHKFNLFANKVSCMGTM
jgi:predicted Na+-dependent transporter